jgi:hypothetical protein
MIEARNDIKVMQKDLEQLSFNLNKKDELLIETKNTFMEVCY